MKGVSWRFYCIYKYINGYIYINVYISIYISMDIYIYIYPLRTRCKDISLLNHTMIPYHSPHRQIRCTLVDWQICVYVNNITPRGRGSGNSTVRHQGVSRVLRHTDEGWRCEGCIIKRLRCIIPPRTDWIPYRSATWRNARYQITDACLDPQPAPWACAVHTRHVSLPVC